MRTSELALILALVACKQERRGNDDEAKPAPEVSKRGPPPLAEKPFYRLDLGPQMPCRAHSPCQVDLVLTALGEHHVNEKYPTKFVLDNDNAAHLTELSGSFKLERATVGIWSLFVRASKPGKYTLKGTFKLSACTDENCEIESPQIAFDVTVAER